MGSYIPKAVHVNPMPDDVDAVLDHILLEDEVLQDVRAASRRAGLPAIAVSTQQGKMMQLLASLSGAYYILEIGTLGGYSTICLARGNQNSRVTTLECEPRYAAVAQENFRRAGIDNRVQVLLGSAVDRLWELHCQIRDGMLSPFDFVFIDADKENNVTYLNWAVKCGKPGTVIVVDNVVREGRCLTQPDKLDFLERLGHNKHLDACVIQTVGGKTWDGFTLAKVK